MPHQYHFLIEDYNGLVRDIDRYEQDYRAWGKVSTEQGGVGDWHDNAAYEESMRQMQMLGKRIHELKNIMAKSKIVTLPQKSSSKVQLGSKVEIEVCETGERNKFLIASYMIFRDTQDSTNDEYRIISYSSPIGRALVNKEVEDEVRVRIGDKERIFFILTIN
jgi:transcription elongation factor GreA